MHRLSTFSSGHQQVSALKPPSGVAAMYMLGAFRNIVLRTTHCSEMNRLSKPASQPQTFECMRTPLQNHISMDLALTNHYFYMRLIFQLGEVWKKMGKIWIQLLPSDKGATRFWHVKTAIMVQI